VWWENDDYFIENFFAESNGEKKLKIDQHLAKLLTKNIVGLFYDSQCIIRDV